MKIFKLFFLSVLVSTMVACSSDDDNNDDQDQDTTAELLGNWVGTEINYTGSQVIESQGIEIEADFVGLGYDIDYSFTFTENPDELTAAGSYSIELTTTVLGQSTTQNVEDLGFDNTGAWSRDGNEISLLYNGESNTATIIELTETTLVLNITEETIEEESGTTLTMTIDSVFTFTRE